MTAPFLSLSSKEERLVVAQAMVVQVRQWEFLPRVVYEVTHPPELGVQPVQILPLGYFLRASFGHRP